MKQESPHILFILHINICTGGVSLANGGVVNSFYNFCDVPPDDVKFLFRVFPCRR